MRTRVVLRRFVSIRHRRQIYDLSMAYAPLGNHVIGELFHGVATSFQHRHFHAPFVIQMDVQSGLREIMVIVEVARQPLRKLSLMMLVDINQCRDARLLWLDCLLLQARSGKIAHCFGAIGVPMRRHIALEVRSKSIINRYGNALHLPSSPSWLV